MPSNLPRVVITGLGMVTPLGATRNDTWRAVRTGTSAIKAVTRFDPSPFRTKIAAEIKTFDPKDYVDAKHARRLDRFSALAVAAGVLACQDAGLLLGSQTVSEAGVYLGSALGGVAFAEEQAGRFLSGGIRNVDPLLALSVFGGAGATNLALAVGAHGPVTGNANSCASGLIAICEAYRAIQRQECAVVLAGGAEAPLAPLTFGSFSLIKAMSARNDDPGAACRPFDRDRDGFVMAEGSAVLVLESLAHARMRGRQPLAEVVGCGITNDAWHMVAPRPDAQQAARAIRLAMHEAHWSETHIEYISAHATGTVLGDVAEAQAIRLALGSSALTTPVGGTKPLHGHALGASGAIETAVALLCMENGWLPPTENLMETADDCGLNHIPAGGLLKRPATVLSNSFGFGGINACIALARVDP